MQRRTTGTGEAKRSLDVVDASHVSITRRALRTHSRSLPPPLSDSNAKPHSSSSPPNVSVSLIFVVSGSSPYVLRLRASSFVYFWMTSALSSWKSRSESRMMSPWLIQTCAGQRPRRVRGPRAFFRIFPRMCANRFSPSKHIASKRPLPSILITCAYSWPSSLKTSSRLRGQRGG